MKCFVRLSKVSLWLYLFVVHKTGQAGFACSLPWKTTCTVLQAICFFFWGGVGVRESGGLLPVHYTTQRGMSTCKSTRGRAKVNRLSLPMSQVAH